MHYAQSDLLRTLEEFGYLNGNRWDELCKKCYSLKYGSNYISVPAQSGGDAGIEGFTNTGIVHQCYCPEKLYTDKELNSHYVDKITTDIGKFLKNNKRLDEFGVKNISEWHFNIPDYYDNRLVSHIKVKSEEVYG
jgi:hypothetical protein